MDCTDNNDYCTEINVFIALRYAAVHSDFVESIVPGLQRLYDSGCRQRT
ncbi:hypothetical protein LGN20_20300 [Burkholderia cepacia]|nr:hypothetical protein [Burkholderia cepacia]MCA8216246.1 hypothetical protein [Burkholderia cepacia]